MKASEFDRLFDKAADIDEAIDWSQATRPNAAPKRVNVDFPNGPWMGWTARPPIWA